MVSKGNTYWLLTVLLIIGGILLSTYISSSSRTQISYAQDVKPILNKNCITCHGGVKKQGKFSLLFQEEAYAITASGRPSIVPFHPEKSDFISRLHSKDPEEKIPYKNEPLTSKEIKILT